jgi:hypothetical protein
MEKLKIIKINDKITINDVDELVKGYLRDKLFYGIEIKHLRALCQIKGGAKYKVVDVCKSCKLLKIKVGGNFVTIKYSYISDVFEN